MNWAPHDFWYAVHHTEILLAPRQRLETFGETVIDYRLVTEPMDDVRRVRVRAGRLQAYRPQIVTPRFDEAELEGFRDPEAGRYFDWLKEHLGELRLVKYGFRLRHTGGHDEVITDSVEAVIARVRADLEARGRPLEALVRGVDEPWEVCLVKLMVEMVQRSAGDNLRELEADPDGGRHEIEQAFLAAARDSGRIGALADLLRRRGVFGEYEDRFFALVRARRGN